MRAPLATATAPGQSAGQANRYPGPVISVFTPSHDPRWLDEALYSMLAQTRDDWEWIVLLNGHADWAPPADERVHVQRSTLENIGALKAQACALARGEILVELDHDDVLLPEALDLIDAAFAGEPAATLVYSDFAQMDASGQPELSTFDLSMGWRSTMELVDGAAYKRWHAFEPTPANVGIIWFAPNHVRAFRTSSYRQIGGHDPSREILDDLDLIHRLYLLGPFLHIPRLLYLARVHDSNSQRDPERNARIQTETIQLYCQRREALHQAWENRLKGAEVVAERLAQAAEER